MVLFETRKINHEGAKDTKDFTNRRSRVFVFVCFVSSWFNFLVPDRTGERFGHFCAPQT